MNYLLKSSRKKSSHRKIAAMVAIIVGILFLIHAIFPRFFPALATSIGVPFWKAENSAVVNGEGSLGYFMSKRLLYEKNIALADENAILKSEMASMSLVQDENDKLKEMLGHPDAGKTVLAAVLRRPPETAYDDLIVDAGSRQGIAVGDVVIVHQHGAVGVVEEVLGSTSKVKLYSTANEKTDIELGTSTVQAVAIGRGGGNFQAVVPRDTLVVPGEIVTLPGTRQYIFGIVEDTVIDPARAFQTVLLRSNYAISQLQWVEIITE